MSDPSVVNVDKPANDPLLLYCNWVLEPAGLADTVAKDKFPEASVTIA